MTSKHRVFSHSTDINYNDYIKNKMGVEIFKNIKSSSVNSNNINGYTIKKFDSHNDLINLTKTYYNYNYYCLDKYSLQATKDLYNSNNSYVDSNVNNIYDNTGNSDNNSVTIDCKNSVFYDNCKEDIVPVLYPYGVYVSHVSNPQLHFNLDLNKWCIKKNIVDYSSIYNLNNINIDGFNGCKNNDICYSIDNIDNQKATSSLTPLHIINAHSVSSLPLEPCPQAGVSNVQMCKKNNCKTGLCKNAKPLFV